MQHLTNADKSLLVGDVVADLLLEYSAMLAKTGSGDTIKLRAVSSDGDEVVANFLLNSGTVLMSETTHSALPEPNNEDAEAYLRERLASFTVNGADLLSLTDPHGDERH